jgi:hypothetical protein
MIYNINMNTQQNQEKIKEEVKEESKCPYCTEPCPWDHCAYKQEDGDE